MNRIEEYLDILKANKGMYTSLKNIMSKEEISLEQATYTAVFAIALTCFVEWVLSEAERQ